MFLWCFGSVGLVVAFSVDCCDIYVHIPWCVWSYFVCLREVLIVVFYLCVTRIFSIFWVCCNFFVTLYVYSVCFLRLMCLAISTW